MHNFKTSNRYWDALYAGQPVPALPSYFSVGSRNLKRLFRQHIQNGMAVLEVGCAPGKQLAMIHQVFGASISGLDYSETGVQLSRRLFEKLQITCDLRCEDIFSTSFQPGSFDLVYSLGVIEHFDNPTDIVARHVELLKPGGTSLMVVPNYGGFYGRLQRYFDSENLDIHNIRIMSPGKLKQLVPEKMCDDVAAFSFGRVSPWLLNMHPKWPRIIALLLNLFINGLGLLQPFDIKSLSPNLVLQVKKKRAEA